MSYHERTADRAKGKWRGILMTLGLPEACLKNKHGPCPLCESKAGFRWDNTEGSGSYICTCGAGHGFELAMKYTGKMFKQIADLIDGMVGGTPVDPNAPRQAMTDEARRDMLRNIYRSTQVIQTGDLADKYLGLRGIDELIYPKTLRFAPSLRDGEGGVRPAMVAMVGVHGQDRFVAMHRTFLERDGTSKAVMASPRKMTAGELPAGACVMIGDYNGGPLGIAEGIETAMSASAIHNIPVWAAINSSLLAKWAPPEGCTEVAIFGDNDANFTGQAAAYALARRLSHSRSAVTDITVTVPEPAGRDFNDIWLEQSRSSFLKRGENAC